MAVGSPDILLMYLIKSTVRMFRDYKSSSWEQTTALVTGQIVLDPCLGCPSIKLHYKFDYDGSLTKGWDEIPILGVLGAVIKLVICK